MYQKGLQGTLSAKQFSIDAWYMASPQAQNLKLASRKKTKGMWGKSGSLLSQVATVETSAIRSNTDLRT